MTLPGAQPSINEAARRAHRPLIRLLRVGVQTLVGVLLFCVLTLTIFINWPPGSSGAMEMVSVVQVPATESLLSGTDYATVQGDMLYASYGTANELLALDTSNLTLRTFAKGMTGVHGLAFSTDGAVGFASLGGSDSVAVLRTVDGSLIKMVPAGGDPDGIVFDNHADLAYVGNGKTNSATLVPAKDLDHPATVPLGGSPEFPQVDESNGFIYQPLENTGEVVVIDPKTATVTKRFDIKPCIGPHGSAIDSIGRVLFLGCSNQILAVMRLDEGKIIAQVPVGRIVDFVAFDARLRRVYTANFGSVTVVSQAVDGSYQATDTVRTAFGGHTLAIDPKTHRVYVICSGLHGAKILVYNPIATP